MKYYNYEERTVGQVVEDKARIHGDKVWLYFGDKEYTYNQMNENSNRFANGLINLGVKKGDHIASLLPNCPEHFYSWFGIVKCGAVDVSINNLTRGRTLLDMIVRSDANTLVLHERFLNKYRQIQNEAINVKCVIFCSETEGVTLSLSDLGLDAPTLLSMDEILKDNPSTPPGVKVNWYDPESIMYSSGTTGLPKGILVPHNYEIEYAWTGIEHMGTTARDVVIVNYPMFNVAGRVETSFRALMADCKAVLFDHFDFDNFWRDINRYGITEGYFVGGVILSLLKRPPSPDDANTTLERVLTAAAGTSVEAKREFEKRFNVMLLECCGQTEIGWASFESPSVPRKIGSQGLCTCGYEVKIVDEHELEVPCGQTGEIVLRPTKPHIMMLEYYKMPEKTAAKLRGCWVHTGDRGKIDKDGYLYFLERIEECIRTKGFLTSITQLEEIINDYPKVSECAIKGVPAAKGEEEDVMVFIKVKAGEILTPEEILNYCEEHMPYYAVPSYVQFIDDLPKTPTQKIARGSLRELGITEKTWDRRKAGYKLSRE